ncbi:type II toxin-antitoxin system MqsR family toxin, partial [Escherichia coli]|uniref:type II toxin-antitoxin system MqsR family toxin n=1 Tax=Escherichia coli TaxID=562 RepID=UPI003D36226B
FSASDFYNSMTTYSDHTIWPDVYRPRLVTGQVYLKITVLHDVLIVSFKEKYYDLSGLPPGRPGFLH